MRRNLVKSRSTASAPVLSQLSPVLITYTMAERLDIILFGATGFTGKHTITQILKLCKVDGAALTWGVSGRSETKLQAILKEMGGKNKVDLSKTPIIVADVSDQESVNKMAASARIVINTAGPYRFYGEQVVKACVEAGTHHVDVSGEPQYMEKMQLKYHEEAQRRGVYIVSACGIDSIPCDLGVIFMQNKFAGTINTVESYIALSTTGGPYPGPSVNYGTWESAIYGLAYANELRGLRTKLFPKRLPSFTPKLAKRSFFHRSSLVRDNWCIPFLGSDRSVAMRSQRHFYDHEKQRPVQLATYAAIGSIFNVILLAIFGGIFGILARLAVGRKLLLNHPKFFSGGFFSREGPSDEKMNNTHFSITFDCTGWDSKVDDPNDEFTTAPNKKMRGKVAGSNPGYGSTCVTLVTAAMMILTESDKMPNKGGVYPPGAAFAKTSIIEKLNQTGDIKFEIVEQPKL